MEFVRRDDLERRLLPGRTQQRAVGREGPAPSAVMSAGFARYSDETGVMEPHAHGEETIYVLEAKDGRVVWGPARDGLSEERDLKAGDLLHVQPGEWHVLRHAPGGFIDILFVFAPPVW